MMLAQQVDSEEAMIQLGKSLAAVLEPGTVLYLHGELGAGKTTLTRGIARGLGHEGAVKSPTYTLVEPYQDARVPLYHFDLYRLGDAQELEFMGIRDYFDESSLVVLEWPERGEGFLPAADLELTIGVTEKGREVAFQAGSERGAAAIESIAAAVGAAG